MSKLDEILFFQSQPMSSNMLADWQVKQAKADILKHYISREEVAKMIDKVQSHYSKVMGVDVVDLRILISEAKQLLERKEDE